MDWVNSARMTQKSTAFAGDSAAKAFRAVQPSGNLTAYALNSLLCPHFRRRKSIGTLIYIRAFVGRCLNLPVFSAGNRRPTSQCFFLPYQSSFGTDLSFVWSFQFASLAVARLLGVQQSS